MEEFELGDVISRKSSLYGPDWWIKDGRLLAVFICTRGNHMYVWHPLATASRDGEPRPYIETVFMGMTSKAWRKES